MSRIIKLPLTDFANGVQGNGADGSPNPSRAEACSVTEKATGTLVRVYQVLAKLGILTGNTRKGVNVKPL